MSISDSAEAVRQRIDKDVETSGFSLDHLFETIKDLKSQREKKMKQDFEFQKEAINLKATARNAGFDVDYDEATNTLRPVTRQAPTPSRVTRLPDGGMEFEQNFDDSGKPTELDPVSKSELLGYESELKARAKQKYPSGASAGKALTEAQRTSIVFGEKVGRLTDEMMGLMDSKEGVNRTMAAGPKFATTIGKMIPGQKDSMNRAERFRDIVDQLKASIPFAKGGKALTGPEKEVLFRLLEYGPNTSNETIKFQIGEFVKEYQRMAELSKDDRTALTDDDLANLSADDIMQMKKSADSKTREARLQKLAEENDLELE